MEKEQKVYIVSAGDKDGMEICQVFTDFHHAEIAEKIQALNSIYHCVEELVVTPTIGKVVWLDVTGGISKFGNCVSHIRFDARDKNTKTPFNRRVKFIHDPSDDTKYQFKTCVDYDTDEDPHHFGRKIREMIIKAFEEREED